MTAQQPVRGILPALVTPLRPDGTFDEEKCPRLVAHVLDGGVHGVLALGSAGEVAALETPTRRRVLEVVAEAVGGRVPLVVGVAQNNLASAAQEIVAAAAVRARAVLVTPPFYSPIDQPTTLAFYRRLAERSSLPIFVYNIPAFTKVMVAPTTVATLAEEGAISGIKDSSRDFEYFEQMLAAVGDRQGFSVLTGTDSLLLASLALGATGAITLCANLVPTWVVRVYELVQSGHWDEARRRQAELLRLVLALRTGVFPTGIKTALALMGICGDTPAPPTTPLPEAERTHLAANLKGLGLLAAGDGPSLGVEDKQTPAVPSSPY